MLVRSPELSIAQLYRALTPQIFRFHVLNRALQLAADQNRIVTDDSAAIESLGLSPVIVPGSTDNIKITEESDLYLLKSSCNNKIH